jgi:hypothetical protein
LLNRGMKTQSGRYPKFDGCGFCKHQENLNHTHNQQRQKSIVFSLGFDRC